MFISPLVFIVRKFLGEISENELQWLLQWTQHKKLSKN